MTDKFYLSTTPDKKDPTKLLAIITIGSPQKGDTNIEICDVKIVDDQEAAVEWFNQMLVEQPWEKRQ